MILKLADNTELHLEFCHLNFNVEGYNSTIAWIPEEDKDWDKCKYKAEAKVHPKDSFSRIKGRKVALARLIKQLHPWDEVFGTLAQYKQYKDGIKEKRRAIWESYKSICKYK